ncbi:hypothetical protein [Parageobacillus thermoglucosidasius]|uniref:PKD domain-containing protein n=1 Tax=Parageobacillus thermoglucosidasius TaxID=1426 RepID=A0AB38R394_PARTM|nr:hypothetical protein [Parageobacillus thermoglucosidasius]UOE78382.1 hypothetical protein IMI45_20310 [Parageobacillus thermoglucosidasius]
MLKKVKFIGAAFAILMGTVFPNYVAAAYTETIPIYSGGDTFDPNNPTVLRSDILPDKDLIRVNSVIKSYPNNKTIWFGPRRYATVYHGHPDDGGRMNGNTTFPAETKDGVKNITAYQFSWLHLAGPFDRSEPTTARVIQKDDYVDDSLIRNLFNGNPDYVLGTANKYYVRNKKTHEDYGKYYWIRDLASLSGGEADNDPDMTLNGINETYLRVIKTDYPDITEFRLKPGSPTEVGKKLELEFEGYEYVSEGRNSYKWLIEVTGPKNGTISGSRTSTKGVTNPAKPYLKRYTGKFTSGSTYFTPQAPGTYTLKLTITDAVQRSVSKTITVTVNNPSNPPGGGSGGSGGSGGTCDAPSIIGGDLRYQYELDLQVTKIQGETVDQNTSTKTPVEVYREDFSANREQVRNEIMADKQKAENEKAQLENQLATLKSQKASLESQLSQAQSAKASCESTPPDEDGNKPDCSGYDSQIASLQNQIAAKEAEIEQKECEIATKKAEIAGFQKELDDLQALEDQWETVNTDVLLTFNEVQKGTQSVSLREGERKTIYFNWTLPSNGLIRAEINPNRDLGIDEVTYSNNALSTPIYIATWEMSSCNTNSSVSAVVMTEKTQTGSKVYKEYFSGSIMNLHPRKFRAGYGFTYTAQTNYSNEYNPSMTGIPNAAVAAYGYAAEAIDNKVQPLDITSTNGFLSTFQPKKYYVAKYSGLVFDSLNPSSPKYDPNDQLIDGGRKWYSPFEQKDGIYPFDVQIGRVGVNHLGVCLRDQVEIKGTAMDDFVKRSVLPDNPFPAQSPGWNWIGKESIITKLKDWFYNKQ